MICVVKMSGSVEDIVPVYVVSTRVFHYHQSYKLECPVVHCEVVNYSVNRSQKTSNFIVLDQHSLS